MTTASLQLATTEDFAKLHPVRRGVSSVFIIAILLVVLAAGGGVAFLFSRNNDTQANQPILIPVTRADFVAQVLDQGEVRSSENVEIRCEVRTGGFGSGSVSVIEVIPEGTMIYNTPENPRDKDTVLVLLDSSSFEKERDQQQLALNTARIAVTQADAEKKVAEQAKKEYMEGIFLESQKTIQNEIFNAEQELQLAKDYYAYSTKLQAKGFITAQQLRGDEIAVAKAENSLALAEKKLEVLENVTRIKEEIRLNSDIEAADVKYNNEVEAERIEEDKLAEIKRQIDNCRIMPPPNVSGQIVYEKEMGRGGSTDWVLAEGATVRERQVLMRIPNPERMEVKALINEQSITAIEKGMPASIKIDALHGKTLKGFVTNVSQYAENEGWMSGSIKKFPVLVKIIDPPAALKPGMNGSVSIQTNYAPNVVQIPVQCIYAAGSDRFALVKRNDQYETVSLEVGGDNSKDVYIKSGLEAGDLVVMNPGNYRDLLELPEQIIDNRIELPEGSVPDDLLNSDDRGYNPDGPSRPEAAQPAAGEAGPGGESARGERGQGRGEGGPGRGEGRGPGSGRSPEAMVDGMMQRMDGNSDGALDSDELADLPEQMRAAIEQSDADGDGRITREELIPGMQRFMEQMRQQGGMGGPPGGEPTPDP